MRVIPLLCMIAGLLGSAGACTKSSPTPLPAPAIAAAGSIARIYYWRARPGRLEEYNRYIREVAEPIDREAHGRDAFISVTTYLTRDTTSTWTHMRVFVLRDSVQLAGLSAALDAAGARLEPDSMRRRMRGEYVATLRDRIGDATVDILR